MPSVLLIFTFQAFHRFLSEEHGGPAKGIPLCPEYFSSLVLSWRFQEDHTHALGQPFWVRVVYQNT